DFARQMARESAVRITNEDDLYKLVGQVVRLKAVAAGLDERLFTAILKEGQANLKKGQATLVAAAADGTLNVSDEVHTLAQKGEVVYLPDPDDIERTIRE